MRPSLRCNSNWPSFTLFREVEAIIREPTVTGGIDRITIHEMLLGLSSDISGSNCLLMLGSLERGHDACGSMSEIKLDLQDDRCVVDCQTSLLCSTSLNEEIQGFDHANRV